MNYITLNNGVQMPQLGLGTFLIPKEDVIDTIGRAYDLGYRSFDTAWRYHNENLIAKALKVHHIPRENVFITTKVNIDALFWFGNHYSKWDVRQRTVKMAVDASFKNLKMDYIDLFLVHWPWAFYPRMYRVLTEYYKQGRIRAIGVSSFLPPHIDSLKDYSDVVPAVNQFEISPLNTQKSLIQHCKNLGIAPQAMSTFSHFRSNEPRNEIINHPQIMLIAEKYGKSTVQVVLRWLIQQGVMVIPKTWNVEHLKENINIFDFSLSQEDMDIIDSLDEGKFLNYDPYTALRNIPKSYRRWAQFLKF